MGELINGRTPEEIITGLKCEVACSKCAYGEHSTIKNGSCSYYVEQDVIALIEHLEAKVSKWISVENELPKKPGTYLCNYEFEESGRIVMSCDYLGDKRWSFMTAHVTHWAPMLEDPKASDDHAGESEV